MPQTLLLADDSATIQRVIELTFADQDIQVVSVGDGDQAIARLEADPPPDIVLADVGMPGKSGYEVAEYVKRTPKLAHIPVVLLTGAFEPVDQVKAAAVGCDAVLAKPFEPQLVISRVRELLGRPAQQPAVDASLAPAASAVDVAPAPRVEDYFDRLDAAFQTLSKPPALASVAAPPVPEALVWLRPQEGEAGRPQEPPASAVADKPADKPAAEPEVAPEPVAVPEPQKPEPVAVAEPPAPLKPVVVAPPEPRAPLERSAPRVFPSIADAFGAILAAEQNTLGVRPEWPTPSQSAGSAGTARGSSEGNSEGNSEIVITDELVDRVGRRVLEQLSDRVVRETVASMASDVAERLVREEIDRIKASIK